MKTLQDIENMTAEEVLLELDRIRQAKRRNTYFGRNDRKEAIEKDPTAYFTRPQDFERAERRTEGSTAAVPRWNHTYDEPAEQ